jgi:hypothetical protein
MLSFTGLWISFPSAFGRFEASAPKARAAPAPADRARALRARPLSETALTVDQALAAASPHATGGLTQIAWPTDQSPEWKVSFSRPGGPAEVAVRDTDARVTPPRPPRPETLARTMRRWHDGTGMGLGWQVAIFLGGIVPALLAATGIVMWWRSRGWRHDAARRRRTLLQPAE